MKNDYTIDELKKAEIDCLSLLDYKLSHYSSLFCLEYFLNQGILWSNEDFIGDLDKLYSLCYRILDFFLEDVRYIDFNPIQISCAVVSLARDYYNLKDSWPSLFVKLFNIKFDEFMNCFIVIKR
jgi:hypothetical protein